jgi:hypothetical protein
MVPRKDERKHPIMGPIMHDRAFQTRPFRRTRTWTQTEVRNSDSDSGSDLRNHDFPTP